MYPRLLCVALAWCGVWCQSRPSSDVIAGQGTIAVELERQWPRVPDAVFVPVGGGGLIGGIGAHLKNRFPGVKVIGVAPIESASMYESLKRGAPFTLDRVGTFADGVAVRRVGDETFRVAQEVVDEIILVSTDEICAAIKDIFEDSRVIVEPAGALAVAGLKRYVERESTKGGTLIAINSGANMNFDRLRHVAERAEIGEHREAVLAVEAAADLGEPVVQRGKPRRLVVYRHDNRQPGLGCGRVGLTSGRRHHRSWLLSPSIAQARVPVLPAKSVS